MEGKGSNSLSKGWHHPTSTAHAFHQPNVCIRIGMKWHSKNSQFSSSLQHYSHTQAAAAAARPSTHLVQLPTIHPFISIHFSSPLFPLNVIHFPTWKFSMCIFIAQRQSSLCKCMSWWVWVMLLLCSRGEGNEDENGDGFWCNNRCATNDMRNGCLVTPL